MALFGRYFSQRDINLVNQFNAELMRDIIETLVVLFKIAPNETNTNIYGEAVAAEGKSFYSGVELSSIIDRGDISQYWWYFVGCMGYAWIAICIMMTF